MYTRAGGGEERERGGTGRGPNVKSGLLDAFGLEDVVAVHAVGRLAGRGVGLRHVRLREFDEVLGVRLGVVVRDVDARLLAGVGVDRGVVGNLALSEDKKLHFLFLVVELRQHRHAALDPVLRRHVARHVDVEDEVRRVARRREDAPSVARLVDRA